jgi:hypothetical protein
MTVIGECRCDRVNIERGQPHDDDCPLSRPPTLTQELIAAGSVADHGTAQMARVHVPDLDQPWARVLEVRAEGEMVVRRFALTPGSFGNLAGSIKFARLMPDGPNERPARNTDRSEQRELARLRRELDAAFGLIGELAGLSLSGAQQLVRLAASDGV